MAFFSAISRLAIAELIIYLLFLPIVVFILIQHGKHGIVGWGFLALFCFLRIVADGLQINNQIEENDGHPTTSTAAIVNSVGISPLLLALFGILYEAAYFTLNLSLVARLLQHVIFHMLIVVGIALAAVGGSNLAQPASSSNSYSSDTTLIEIGYILLLIAVILLSVYALYIYYHLRRSGSGFDRSDDTRQDAGIKPKNVMPLVYWTMIAIAFAAVRVLYGVVYAFSSDKEKLSPVTGSFAIKFLLIFGVQFVAASCLLVGGVMSRKQLTRTSATELRDLTTRYEIKGGA